MDPTTPGFAEGLAQHQEAAAAAWVAYRDAAAAADSRQRVVRGAQRLEDLTPEGWGEMLRDVVERVEVQRGRGAVEDRVRIVVREGQWGELPQPTVPGLPVGEERPPLTDADAPPWAA